MPGQNAAYQHAAAKGLMIMTMEFLSRSVEVFIRINFGQRYFDLLGASGAGLTLFIVFMIAAAQLKGQMQFGNLVLGLYLLAYVVVACCHIYWAKRRKETVHSRYSGMPLLHLLLQEWWPRLAEYHVKMYVEPVAVFLLAIPVAILSPQLSAWLTFSSMCMFVRGQRAWRAAQEKWLDIVDSQIEAQTMGDVIKGVKQPAESKGCEVWGVFSKEQQEILLKQAGNGQ